MRSRAFAYMVLTGSLASACVGSSRQTVESTSPTQDAASEKAPSAQSFAEPPAGEPLAGSSPSESVTRDEGSDDPSFRSRSRPSGNAAQPRRAAPSADMAAPTYPAPAEGKGSGAAPLASDSERQGPLSIAKREAEKRRAYKPYKPTPAPERPGLATSWGENRTSPVSTLPFSRESASRPFATTTLFYNDEAGVRAMARHAGIPDLGFSPVRLAGGALSVRLLDAQGQPLPSVNISGRTHWVGMDGERYVIQLENHTANRFEAVATVDGLDVIDGRPGSFAKRGYIVSAHETIEIDGFRRSNDEVAAFRFGAVKDSYAARKGDDRNVGVIGVALFQEAGSYLPWRPWRDREIERRRNAEPFPGRFASPPPGSE